MSKKHIIDFSPLAGLSITNYSLVYNSNLSSMFKDIEDMDFIRLLEDNIIKNIIFCLIKKIILTPSAIFEISIDIVNETFKTTLMINDENKNEVEKYMETFETLFNSIQKTKDTDFYPVDEIGNYKLIMMEINNENIHTKERYPYLFW